MKITFIAPFFYPVEGGMEKHVFNLALEMRKLAHEVTILTTNLSRTKKIKIKEEVYKGIKIKRLNSWFKIGEFGSFFPSVYYEAIKDKSDIIHIHAYRHPSNLIALFKKNVVITPHWPNYPNGLRKKWIEILILIFDKTIGKRVLKKSKFVFAVAEPEIEWIKKFNINSDKIKLIPNGIPKSYLKKRNNKNFRKRYNINGKIVLYFGRIHKSKGVDQIIKISKYFPKINFVIMGNGSEINNLKLLGKDKKNIKFITGKISEEEKLEAFAAADIFLHPSHYDAFGITLLEAFSQSCPVITTNKGGLPWVAKGAGLIFKDDNLEDLKNQINKMLNNKLRKTLSIKAKNKVKSFTWDNIVLKLEKEYRKILK